MTPLETQYAKAVEKVQRGEEVIVLAASQKEVWGIKSGFRDFKKNYPTQGAGISIYVRKPQGAGGKWMVEFKENTTLRLMERAVGEASPSKELDIEAQLDAFMRAGKEG